MEDLAGYGHTDMLSGDPGVLMVDREIRELIEDVANLVAIQVARPIETRLTILETKIQCGSTSAERQTTRRWKLVGLILGVPGWIAAVVALLRTV